MAFPDNVKSQAAVTTGSSALRRYQTVVVGRSSTAATLYYELCMLIGVFPGALGLFLRKLFWPRMFRSCGKGTVFGANISVRHPHRIDLGERVVISDGCILDARSEGTDRAIILGNDTILSNMVMISCKNGSVRIGARAGIGAQTIIHSVNNSPVVMGDDVMIGPRCYFAGGGNYNFDRTDIPMSQQGLKDDSGVKLESDIWLGANVTVLPGVTMHAGSVAGAGSVVTKSVPQKAVCAGSPAKTIKIRDNSDLPILDSSK